MSHDKHGHREPDDPRHARGDRAIGPAEGGPGTPKGPKSPEDTTSSGDDKHDMGEDNQQRKSR
jgi:hypothetical protein